MKTGDENPAEPIAEAGSMRAQRLLGGRRVSRKRKVLLGLDGSGSYAVPTPKTVMCTVTP